MNGIAGLSGLSLKKKALFVDCDDYEAGSNTFRSVWQKRIVAFFEKNVPRRARGVTTNSQFMSQKLVEWGVPPEKIHYLPNGVELDRFPPPPPDQVAALKASLGLQDKKVVGYIGSLSLSNHPVDLLLEAFVCVRQLLPNTALLIVGGGEDYHPLIQKAQDLGLSRDVVFTGRVEPEKAALYYHLADVSVDPVLDDDAARGRSPLKMFESWACGTPFVTADVGDRRSLMGSPPAGVLTSAGNAQSLADGIAQVIGDGHLAGELRQRGLNRVGAYASDRLASELEAVYRSAFSGESIASRNGR